MSKWENDIDKTVKNSLSNLNLTPPADLKASIGKELFPKSKAVIWMSLFGFVILFGLGMTYFLTSDQQETDMVYHHGDSLDHTNNISNISLQNKNQEKSTGVTEEKRNIESQLNETSKEGAKEATQTSNGDSRNDLISTHSEVQNRGDVIKNDVVKIKEYQSNYNKKNVESTSDSGVKGKIKPQNTNEIDTEELKIKNEKETPLTYSNSELEIQNESKNKSEIVTNENVKSTLTTDEVLTLEKESIEKLNREVYDETILSNNIVAFIPRKPTLKPIWEIHAIGGVGTQGTTKSVQSLDSLGNSLDQFMLNSPQYQFGLNTRVFIKDWHISTGIGVISSQMKSNLVHEITTSTQTGMTYNIDTTWINDVDSLGDTTQVMQIDSVGVPIYSTYNESSTSTYLHKLKTLNIPLKFGYRFRFNKFHLMIGAGVQFNIPVSTSSKLQVGDSFEDVYTTVKESPYKSANMQLLLETELHYKFNSHWSVSLIPSYRYQLTPVFKSDAMFRRKKNSGFISLGLHYYF